MSNNKDIADRRLGLGSPDSGMVTHIRLLLAVSALLTVFIETPSGSHPLTWLVFIGYTGHTMVLCLLSHYDRPLARNRLVHWLDVGWYAAMVLATRGTPSLFFLFFFFAILTASFKGGFDEGARVTVVSALLFFTTGVVDAAPDALATRLLRTTFLLALGYMIAHWGQSELALRKRLALVRDVSRLSNPRFGVDQTVTSVMRTTQDFFGAASCILVTHADAASCCIYRAVKDSAPNDVARAQQVDPQAMAPLLEFARGQVLTYRVFRFTGMPFMARWRIHDGATDHWLGACGHEGDRVAELLDARAFISAPVPLRHGEGRIYVMGKPGGFSRADALFLGHIAAQAFPVIENIELLDKIASEAASHERKKIANDLHDTVIQPYIGLKLGLHAMRANALPDNPLRDDLAKLNDMADQVISDLRQYAGRFNGSVGHGESVFLESLHRQAEQVRKFYGIDITISIDGSFTVSDRLAAEVYHVVSEGLSNIRKHTSARRGSIHLRCTDGWLNIQIENDGDEISRPPFTPRSITLRAAALGGHAKVLQAHGGQTAVHIEIPV